MRFSHRNKFKQIEKEFQCRLAVSGLSKQLFNTIQDLCTGCNGIYRVANTRFFGGLSLERAAEVLGVSERVVHRHWGWARAWLSRELSDSA